MYGCMSYPQAGEYRMITNKQISLKTIYMRTVLNIATHEVEDRILYWL